MSEPQLDLGKLLAAVGDLELNRRALMERIQQLELENNALRAAQNGSPEPELSED